MAARTNWEADKMLDVYIYDYLVKRNLQATAKAFITEGEVATDPVAIDAPGGFLFEWWSIFWDIFHSTKSSTTTPQAPLPQLQAGTGIGSGTTPPPPPSPDIKSREQQMKLHLLQQQHAHLHRRDPSLNAAMNALNSSDVSAVLASKMMEDRMRNPNPVDSEASQQLLDANRIALLKSATNQTGLLVHGATSVNMPPMHQIQSSRNQQLDIKGEVAMSQRTMPTDPSSLYGSGMMQSKPGLVAAGLNQGVGSVPLKGWPLTVPGIDQLRSNLGVQKQLMPSSNQFQLLSPHQQLIAQAQTQNDLARMGSPAPSGSPNVRSDDPDFLMKLKGPQMQQSSGHRLMELQQQHQQLQQNTRKRKPTSSGAANSTGTGNTVGPSPPSTPSTQTAGGGVPAASNVNIVLRSSMICGADGTSGLASSSNQMDNLDSFVDFDENVDSFLSNDDGDGRDMFAALKKGSSEHNSDSFKSLSLNEVGNNRTSNNKVVCCHFSTDGKLLASAGHEKKVFLWNMDNFKMDTKIEDHTNFITDIRFKTNSTQLATSSSDGTVRLWNAADESGALQTFHGHSSHVTSVDFHPRLTEVLCSCDDNGEIRFWKVGQSTASHVFRAKQGGTGRVRFQPRSGKFLAVAAGSMVNIFDVEKQANLHSPPKGHNSEVNCVCWDESGEYLASVSQDTVKVWSVASGACIHELRSHGNQYQSCIFHPRYPKVLIVGGYQTLELWSLSDNQSNPIQAHEGLVAALAHSPFTGMIASGSHDRYVKLWK
ncbi:transcriptional corepressor LEUNIG_HOMOLOG-like isoform X2 [Phragmites australis]|uniref:transcriptional corepressor LEUNIG_HOMOLOG-like isoform X2 n=1 Tax=Phragmites australis TaxID=29695 RepID=UPI002D765D49|nr:transcriptional corepressor LEUNIG_HOMOLOG-like isoform X2 [Phragmites australis]